MQREPANQTTPKNYQPDWCTRVLGQFWLLGSMGEEMKGTMPGDSLRLKEELLRKKCYCRAETSSGEDGFSQKNEQWEIKRLSPKETHQKKSVYERDIDKTFGTA